MFKTLVIKDGFFFFLVIQCIAFFFFNMYRGKENLWSVIYDRQSP